MSSLIAVDLDGTLLNASGKVSPKNLEAILNLRAAGFEVVPATGRSWRESRRVLETIEAKGLAITSGGSVLSDAATGATQERLTIDALLARQLAESLLERGLLVHVLRDHASSAHDYCLVGDGKMDPAAMWWLESHNVPVQRVGSLTEADVFGFDHVLRVGAVDRGDILLPVCADLRVKFHGRATMQSWSAAPGPKQHSWLSRTSTNCVSPACWKLGRMYPRILTGRFSSTVTRQPRAPSRIAAASPPKPLPITTAWGRSRCCDTAGADGASVSNDR